MTTPSKCQVVNDFFHQGVEKICICLNLLAQCSFDVPQIITLCDFLLLMK